jgi:DNA replication protein DnaC
MISQTEIERLRGFPFDEIGIPTIYWESLSNISAIKPGLESEPCKFVLAQISHLNEGGMLILGGSLGCGKTFAAYLALALFIAERAYRLIPEQNKFNNDFEDEIIPEHIEFRKVKTIGLIAKPRDILQASFSDERDKYSNFKGLLMIDDFGREHFTDRGFGIAEWDALIDSRYSWKYPTIFTTNLTDKELVEKYNNRILDRLREVAKWKQFAGQSLRKKSENNCQK